ncbi:hypothetical protein, partial [uncultured Parasutterella sp.]|uniref:hypothetical protein n=1 Tax=uncultured Parasutterella sp. TaxID=1263098 RepID=UPI00272A3425
KQLMQDRLWVQILETRICTQRPTTALRAVKLKFGFILPTASRSKPAVSGLLGYRQEIYNFENNLYKNSIKLKDQWQQHLNRNLFF